MGLFSTIDRVGPTLSQDGAALSRIGGGDERAGCQSRFAHLAKHAEQPRLVAGLFGEPLNTVRHSNGAATTYPGKASCNRPKRQFSHQTLKKGRPSAS